MLPAASPPRVAPQEQQADGYETRTFEAANWAYVSFEKTRTPDEAFMEGEQGHGAS